MWQRLVNCIERRNSKLYTYKVSYTSPHSGKKKKTKEKRKSKRKWVPVDDISSLTLYRGKQKQQVTRLSKKNKIKRRAP